MTTDDVAADLETPAEPYRDGRVHVMAEKCSTCVFRPGNPMSLRPGQLKDLTDHVQETGVPFSCHQTLPYAGAEHVAFYGGAALCAGAVANYAADSPQMQLAIAMDVVTHVDPAPAEVGKLALAPTACEWFAMCGRPAAGVVAHPILGDVPTCQTCADKHDLDLVPRS